MNSGLPPARSREQQGQPRRRVADALGEPLRDRGLVERTERQRVAQPAQRQLVHERVERPFARAPGGHHEQPRGLGAARERDERLERRGVAPVHVLEHEHERLGLGELLEQLEHLAQHPVARRAAGALVQQLERARVDEPGHLDRPRRRAPREQLDQLAAARPASQPAERIQERQVGLALAVALEALAARDQPAGLGEERLDERGLADAGLAGHQDDAPAPGRRPGERGVQPRELGVAAERPLERGQGPGCDRGRRRGGPGHEQADVVGEDRALERAQPGRRVDAELLVERPAVRLVGGQRVGLAPAAVEREHQLPAQALAQRVARDLQLELGDHVGMEPERQVGLDPVLQAGEPQLLQPHALGERERLGELGQRGPAPDVERLAQALGGRLRVAAQQRRAAAPAQGLEAVQVDRVGLDLERVAASPRAQHAVRQHLAQLRDVDLDHLGRRLRRGLAPQLVDQRLDGDRAVGVQEQAGQQSARLAAAESERRRVGACLERTQQPEVHERSSARVLAGAQSSQAISAAPSVAASCARPR